MQPPAALLGTWGTPTQCPAKQAESPPAARFSPYHISTGWIQQGGIYCYLSWLGHYADDTGSETHALAQCGEDSLREYRILLRLENSRLRIRWSESYRTPALERCD